MAKRKKVQLSPSAAKGLIICIVVPVLTFFIFSKFMHIIMQSDYFKVQSIVIEDPNLQFIDQQDLTRLRGRSIFTVNLKDIQKKLNMKYPQVAGLRIVRNFPNQIMIVARKRIPYTQVRLGNRIVMLDLRGVVVATTNKPDNNLPLILGVKTNGQRIFLGQPFLGQDVQAALKVLKIFQINKGLSAYRIARIDVSNLSNIEFYLTNNLKIIFDWDKIEEKINTLSLMLSQGQLKLNEITYIDLRFKEPIIGQNNAKKDD